MSLQTTSFANSNWNLENVPKKQVIKKTRESSGNFENFTLELNMHRHRKAFVKPNPEANLMKHVAMEQENRRSLTSSSHNDNTP